MTMLIFIIKIEKDFLKKLILIVNLDYFVSE